MATSLLRREASTAFNSRLHVILMPAFLTGFWDVAFRFALPAEYYLMICLNTAGAYWTNFVTDEWEDSVNYAAADRFLGGNTRRARWLVAFCYSGSLLLGLRAGWPMVLFGTIFNGLGTLYGLEVRWGPRTFRVKSIPWLKNAYSSLFWSAGLLLAPYIYRRATPDARLALAIPCTFLLAFFVEMLWDVRDMKGDRAAGVRTVPIVLGEPACRRILHALNVAATSLFVGGIVSGRFPPSYWTIVPHALGAAGFIEAFFRMTDRRLASHAFLIFEAVIMLVTIVAGNLR